LDKRYSHRSILRTKHFNFMVKENNKKKAAIKDGGGEDEPL
jgi:hypothetical protein